MAREPGRQQPYDFSVVRFVAMIAAGSLAIAACSDSTDRSRGPVAPTSTTSVARRGRDSTGTCPHGVPVKNSVMPTPTLAATTNTYAQSLRLGPPPRDFRPESSAAKAWQRWLAATAPCESVLCGRSAATTAKLVLTTATWNEGHGHGVGGVSHIAWAVLAHSPGPPPGTPARTARGEVPLTAAPKPCYWYDTFVTFDARTGEPFGGSMSLGTPG
jgi:hypothetical protein